MTMDQTKESALPSKLGETQPHAILNLTLDPTGTKIESIPATTAPLYTLTKTLLKVHSTTSIHVQRAQPDGTTADIYAIGEHFISPLHPTRIRDFRHVQAARSHGLLVAAHVREIVWDFSTHVAAPPSADGTVNPASYPVDPVYMIGTAPGPGTVEKHLLQFYGGRWMDVDDEVVALEREGSAEEGGFPVLSVTKELDQETMDFLVSAWCVTMWGELGKRARQHSKSEGGRSKLSRLNIIGKFKLG